jgi:Mn2+/Fe2+ NRAMP family transporter
MYEPTFGVFARHVLLVGAFAVLYSTFFVGTASFARLGADCLALYGLIRDEPASRSRWQSIFCVAFPILCLASYLVGRQPVAMVAISGVTQAVMLPLIGIALLYLRGRRTDRRIRGGWVASVSLWLATLACAVAASYGAYASARQALAPAKKPLPNASRPTETPARAAEGGPAGQR